VGGTHPALVEAMGYGNCVLVNDTPSNLEVISEAGVAYRGAEEEVDLQRKMQQLLEAPDLVEQYRTRARERAQTCYRWEDVVLQHARLYQQVVEGTMAVEESNFAESTGS
jgi:glycosyltransferase involved in cell wall biosynthesis